MKRLMCASAMVFAACAGEDGMDGMDGQPGDEDVPSVSAITPEGGFLDRQMTVTISGNATEFADGTTVDFGAGVTVDELIVASPTALVADITIAPGAELGRRDVTVDDLTYDGAFLIEAPLAFTDPVGRTAQGSIVLGRVRQKDIHTPFDTTGAPDYPYLAIDAGEGTSGFVLEATPYTMDVQLLIDVTSPTGLTDISAFSDDSAQGTTSLAPGAMTIAARTPVALTSGTPTTGTVAAAFDTNLYSFTPAPHQLITVTATSTDADALTNFALLPPSGRWADLISYGATGKFVSETADPFYVVYWDNSGLSGYDFEISIDAVDSDDLEPNDTCATAQAITTPADLENLALNGAGDEDWFSLDLTGADAGKKIHVVTSPGDTNTDTYVEVYGGTCGTLVPLGPPSVDTNYHENHMSDVVPAAGTYFVRVRNSPGFPFAGSIYNMTVDLATVETEPNNVCAEAQVAGLPYALGGATLSSSTDEDWYELTVDASSVGDVFWVRTKAGDTNTDTLVEVSAGACGSLTSLGVSSDNYIHEVFVSDPVTAAGTHYVTVSASPLGSTGDDYQLLVDLVTPTDDNEDANDACAGATSVPLGTPLLPLALDSDADEDWFMVTATATDVGSTVHVTTEAGEPFTDTVVEVFEGSGCGSLTSLGVSSDAGYHENLTSDPITAAGPIWVRVSYSTFGFDEAEYVLHVAFE